MFTDPSARRVGLIFYMYRVAQIKRRHFTFLLVTNECIYKILCNVGLSSWYQRHKSFLGSFIDPVRFLLV